MRGMVVAVAVSRPDRAKRSHCGLRLRPFPPNPGPSLERILMIPDKMIVVEIAGMEWDFQIQPIKPLVIPFVPAGMEGNRDKDTYLRSDQTLYPITPAAPSAEMLSSHGSQLKGVFTSIYAATGSRCATTIITDP